LETRLTRQTSAKANKKHASLLCSVINYVFLNVPSGYLKRIEKVWGEEWDRKSQDLNPFVDRNQWIAFITGVITEWNAYSLIVCAFLVSL
jgi:hypothetical protein